MAKTELIPASPGTYALLVRPQHTPEDQDFSQIESWAIKTPIVGWLYSFESEMASPIGASKHNGEIGDVYLFPDGQVYCESRLQTFPNLAAWIAVTFAVDPPAEFATKPQSAPARPPVAEEVESPTLRDLGVSGRACAPLERMGVETLAQLAVQSRADIAEVKGVSTSSVKEMDRLLKEHGLAWDWSPGTPPEEPVEDDEDDEMEDLIG